MSLSYRHQCRPSQRERAGFALLITIVLIAFLVLLVVSMASLTRVEIQVATNYQQLDQARHNALVALDLAMGQLQAAAGPDQRITARAEILDSTPTTAAIDGVNQPYWTGVWITGNASTDVTSDSTIPQRQTTFGNLIPSLAQKSATAIWLVSRPTSTAAVDPIGGPTGSTITLASQLGNTPTDVKVPLVDLTATVPGIGVNQTIGRYGYWVSDEGVKARVNLKDPTLKTDSTGATQVDAVSNLATNLLHFSAPQATAAHKILPGTLATDFRGAADYRQNPKIDQVLTPQSLPLLPAVAPTGYVSNTYLPDITTYSYGILADVRNGGLRKDLTAGLEDSAATTNKNYAKLNPTNTQRVYNIFSDTIPIATKTTVTYFGQGPIYNHLCGLLWSDLHRFYNSYKSTQPTFGVTAPDPNLYRPVGIGSPTATRPYSVSSANFNCYDSNLPAGANSSAATSLYATGQLSPICIGLRYDVVLSSKKQTDGNYKLLLNYYPFSIWYNPYAVSISDTKQDQIIGVIPEPNTYLKIAYTTGGAANTTYCVLNQANTASRLLYNNDTSDTLSYEPGAIRVFGMTSALSTAINPIATVSAVFGGTTGSLFKANNFGPNYSPTNNSPCLKSINAQLDQCTQTEFLGVANLADVKSKTIPYNTLSNLPGATSITLSLGTIGGTSTYTGQGPSEFQRWGYGYCAWPNITLKGKNIWETTQGISAGKTGAGIATTVVTSPTATFLISQLTTPQLLFTYNMRTKGLKSFSTASYGNSAFNIPSFMGNSDVFNPISTTFSGCWNEFHIPATATWPTVYSQPSELSNLGDSDGYTTTTWGDSSTGVDPVMIGGSYRKVLADIPIQPMVSLGQFMHLQAEHYLFYDDYARMTFGSMFVGGSCPNPAVPLNQTLLEVNSSPTLMIKNGFYSLDNSYLANQALFDTFYFSTVPPANLPAAVTSPNPPQFTPVAQAYPANWVAINNNPKNATQYTDPTTPFLNSRIITYNKNGAYPAMADLRDMDKAAANLLLVGAFNVNSTSVNAWRALLSSLSGNDLSLWNASTRSTYTFTASELKNPIPRFWSATGNANVNTAWCGVRALSDNQITDLATRIVTEVKIRGPFLSMADFLNRRLGVNSTDLTRAGTLQSAIDKTDINTDIKVQNGTAVNVTAAITGSTNLPAPLPIINNMLDASSSAGQTWNTTLGMPGYLMQQDLVQAFSPVMSARSDTFVVRTYGEKTNPLTGKAIAKVYCEAVVQRVPDYVDQKDSALTTVQPGYTVAAGDATPISLVNPTNQTFGRRFKIISFRWLSPNEL